MSSDYRKILQLPPDAPPDQLERAWRLSRARYERLTSAGPLAPYRSLLLAAAAQAYHSLRRELDPLPPPRDQTLPPPARPALGPQLSLRARAVQHLRPQIKGQPPSQAQIEDEFCREVLYRLEGDLLRYDSRRELLALAQKTGVPPFQANLLMGQIVQAVRQHRLYRPSASERRCAQPPRPLKRGTAKLLALAALLAALLDVLAVWWLTQP